MKYRAVIFDLDGTLVHTEPEYRYKIIGDTLRELGVIYFSPEHMDMLWFETERNKIIKKCFGQEPEIFWKVYTKKESVELRKQFIKAYADIDFILRLKEIGYKTGIVTGSPEHIVDLEVGMLGKEHFDSVVVARNSAGIMPKPHPHGLEKCIKSLNIQKHESLFVGNAEEDILTAKNAGVSDVFLERGEYKFEFGGIKPSTRINSLYKLRYLLNV